MKFLPFVWLNLTRNRLRTVLTAGAIALAIALVCLLLTMPAGMNAILEDFSSNTRIVVHNEAGLVYPLPYAYIGKIRALDGVVGAASWTWFGGAYDVDEGVAFPNFAVEPDMVGVVWEDYRITPEQLDAFRRYRDGAIVGRSTLRSRGWKIGDRVTLSSTVFPVELDFQIVGEIASERAPHFLFQREYLDQALRAAGTTTGLDFLGTVWVRVDDAARVDPLLAEIDRMFRNSEAETASETEESYFKNFFSQLEGFVSVILLVTGLVTLCLVFIAANTASMSVRERLGEIAVLKAIGFRRRLVFVMLLAEGVVLALLGGAAGALISIAITGVLRAQVGWNPALGPLGSFIVTPAILVQALFLALFVGMISGVVPSLGAARRGVAATLREVF